MLRGAAMDMLELITKHFGGWKPKALPRPEPYAVRRPKGVERVEVRWPGGRREVFARPPVDRLITLTEGTGAAP